MGNNLSFYIKSALHRPVFISLFWRLCVLCVLCGLIIPMQPEVILVRTLMLIKSELRTEVLTTNLFV